MRLIDADALNEAMYHEAFETDTEEQKWDGGCWIRYKMFENKINEAQTIEERKTGRWKNESKRNPFSTCKDRIYWRMCSACGWCREDCNPANDTPYCPNCGARMERSRRK